MNTSDNSSHGFSYDMLKDDQQRHATADTIIDAATRWARKTAVEKVLTAMMDAASKMATDRPWASDDISVFIAAVMKKLKGDSQ